MIRRSPPWCGYGYIMKTSRWPGKMSDWKLFSWHTSHGIYNHKYPPSGNVPVPHKSKSPGPPGEVFRDFLSNNLIVPSSWNKLTLQVPTFLYLWSSLLCGKDFLFLRGFQKTGGPPSCSKMSANNSMVYLDIFRLQGFNLPITKMSTLCSAGFTAWDFLKIWLLWLSFAARLWRRWFRNIDPQLMVGSSTWLQKWSHQICDPKLLPEWLLATLRSCTSFGFQSIWRKYLDIDLV